MKQRHSPTLLLVFSLVAGPALGEGAAEVALPASVKAVWNLDKAFSEKTATRERVSVNGLWRWQPVAPRDAASGKETEVPAGNWGFFKVPGSWPGTTDYMQKDCQTVFANPVWKDTNIREVSSAWYQREMTVPAGWAGRRITLSIENLNSLAAVFVDGRRLGDVLFPGGEIDLTAAVKPGSTHVLSLLVIAMPFRAVMISYGDSARAKEVRGSVDRRGLCGDLWLAGEPVGPRLSDVRVATSVRKWEISFSASPDGLAADTRYVLKARVRDGKMIVKEFKSKPFGAPVTADGRCAFTAKWKPPRLWDLHTPGNQYDLDLSLEDAKGRTLDAALPVRFGFREFWIDGRDFRLNGSRIHCSVLPTDNSQVGAAWSTYEGALETFARLKAHGFNAVYTHNYGCEPGTHLGFNGILRAADDAGILLFFSMPHFGQYEWKEADAEKTNGYARHALPYVRTAGSHPSVVLYAMSHNGAGYAEDMNPDMMAGAGNEPDRGPWSKRNAEHCLRAEEIVRGMDPTRTVYHHSAGDLGSMDTINFYANFSPAQEQADWFESWAAKGKRPLFLCEYGAPLTWDFTMYRGWYKGKREFGSGVVPWEYCIAEWNSQYYGDRAFGISETEKRNLRWEAARFREGKLWYRWDYPVAVGDRRLSETHEIFAKYLTAEIRAFRAFGLSGYCLWDHSQYWQTRDSTNRDRKELPVDWESLQRPGFSPDYLEGRYETWENAFEREDWVPTVAGRAIIRNNAPLLGWLAGRPEALTGLDHDFLPGEKFKKTLVVINESRKPVTCACEWSFALPKARKGARKVKVATGEQARIPLSLEVPADTPAGTYTLSATFRFSDGTVQEDSFAVQVLTGDPAPSAGPKTALLDPAGKTAADLKRLGVAFDLVPPGADLSGYDLLVVGREALAVDGQGPDLGKVRDGLKVVVFEQSAAVLEKRFGFRIAEYGLREVFPRVPGHPALAGLGGGNLRDWRGEATLQSPRLAYEMGERGISVKWCDISVTRVWRCGNRGNVASILIEKPARGNFLPLLDGGYSLQYTPLMEYREGKGLVLFCQADVTGRTDAEPAADRLVRNLLAYASGWKPARVSTQVRYAGGPAGLAWLKAAGISVTGWKGEAVGADEVLVLGPGAAKPRSTGAIAGRVLCVGLSGDEARALAGLDVRTEKKEHIAAVFEPLPVPSPLAGVGPADVHNRGAWEIPLLTGGVEAVGDGVLALGGNGNAVFCQLVPWQFDYAGNYGLKRTFRRSSFLVNRILAGLGAGGTTPLLDRFKAPPTGDDKRWLSGFYLDDPEEWDDPYRFFRW